MLRHTLPPVPTGWNKARWYGPGLLWMLSAVGTGSILFTPRVAAEYEYQLLWLLLLVVFFMWVMIREMARYSIVTGQTMLDGMYALPGPRGWAVWFILLPQLMAAAAGIAGLAAVVGSALQSLLPGGGGPYAVALVVLSTFFVARGRYRAVERFSQLMASLLMIIVLVAAAAVAPGVEALAGGLRPSWPAQPELYIILPWVGTILAGSMGIVWFGYWTATRGYGGGLASRDRDEETPADAAASTAAAGHEEPATRVARARGWVRLMTGAATLGVGGGLLVIIAFLVLGAELLAPENKLPQGADVAADLTTLFSSVWGQPGEYLLLAAIVIALGGSVLANQDGWGRSFADMTLILTRRQREAGRPGRFLRLLGAVQVRTGWRLQQRRPLKRAFIVLVTAALPVLIILLSQDPVRVMSASGLIAAMHTPFIALTALWVNRRRLPEGLRPGRFASLTMTAAGLFYLGFAAVYLWNLAQG